MTCFRQCPRESAVWPNLVHQSANIYSVKLSSLLHSTSGPSHAVATQTHAALAVQERLGGDRGSDTTVFGWTWPPSRPRRVVRVSLDLRPAIAHETIDRFNSPRKIQHKRQV